jgi:hypothetical protein
MIQLKDIKEAVAEIMNEIDYNQLALDMADDQADMRDNATFWGDRTTAEKKLLKTVVQLTGEPAAANKSFTDVVLIVANKLGMDPGDWPARSRAWRGDIKFYPKDALNWVCQVAKHGLEGGFGNMVIKPSGECPDSWGAKENSLGSAGSVGSERWIQRLSVPEQKVLSALRSKLLSKEIPKDTDIADVLLKVASELGIEPGSLPFLRDPEKIKQYLQSTLPGGTFTESKKRGFGEGEPPPEEIYKKREIVQEVELETPDIAKELGDASKEQGEATMGVADAHTRGAEAAKQRQEASKAWKDAKITQIKAVDAAEKYADQEAKAMDAQSQAMEAAQKAADAGEAASAEKEKMLDVAKQAHEQEKEAASAAEEAAAAEEEAATELADTNTAASETGTERSELETEFGDAIASDEEAKEDAAEEKEAESEKEDAEAEKEKKAEQDADADAKEEEREANDEKAADDAEAEEETAEEEPEEDESSAPEATFGESLMSMIRKEYKLLRERKWGDEKEAGVSPQQKLQKAGLTADDLRSMVLNTVVRGEEERDREMIKLLKDMLMSLRSIEYHTTPTKGAGAQHAQTAASAWVKESKNRERVFSAASTISEMRTVGMLREADDHESFFRWIVDNPSLTLQEIKNEADAQISDIEAELRKLDDQYVEEDPFLKQKAEVPGHHN